MPGTQGQPGCEGLVVAPYSVGGKLPRSKHPMKWKISNEIIILKYLIRRSLSGKNSHVQGFDSAFS